MRRACNRRWSSLTDRIAVARIGRPHGIRGDVTAVALTDDPDRFDRGAKFQTDGPEPVELTLAAARSRGEGLILHFSEVSDRDAAEELRGHLLTISPSERRSLPEGEYWPSELIGLEVRSPEGSRLGRIADVVSGETQDRLVVEDTSGSLVDVPFVAALVLEISLEDGIAKIVPIDGLFN